MLVLCELGDANKLKQAVPVNVDGFTAIMRENPALDPGVYVYARVLKPTKTIPFAKDVLAAPLKTQIDACAKACDKEGPADCVAFSVDYVRLWAYASFLTLSRGRLDTTGHPATGTSAVLP